MSPKSPTTAAQTTAARKTADHTVARVTKSTESRVRAICMALPEVTEKLSHGAPSFFVNKQFVMLWPDGHHDHHFPHLWCAAPPGAQDELVDTEPDRFFRPPAEIAGTSRNLRLHRIFRDWPRL